MDDWRAPRGSSFRELLLACMTQAGEHYGLGRPLNQTELSRFLDNRSITEGSEVRQTQISKWLHPTRPSFPIDRNLQELAQAFQDMGIDVTFEEFKRARDVSEMLDSPRTVEEPRLRICEVEANTFPDAVKYAWIDGAVELWRAMKMSYEAGRKSR